MRPVTLIIVFGMVVLFSCQHTSLENSNQHILAQLDKYHQSENFFKLKSYYELHQKQLSKKDQLFFHAILQNAFNTHEDSNKSIDKAIEKYGDRYSAEDLYYLHKTKFYNHFTLFDYEAALKQCNILKKNYKDVMDSVKYKNLIQDSYILNALRDAPAQEIHKFGNSWIDLRRDNLDLLNITVNIEGDSMDFLFDSGSSFSFIRRSIAEKYGMNIYDVDIEVESAGGQSVSGDIALLDTFSIGNIEITNAFFWVFDDRDLTLPEFNYSVNGALGFPIFRSLEEVHIIFDTRLFVPAYPIDYDKQNMALDDHDPIVAIIQQGDTLPYYFDTGIAFSSLYKPYYLEHSEYIDSTCEQKTYTVGALGGVTEFTSYIMDSIELSIAGNSAWIKYVEVHTDYIYKDNEKVYGNLGQDFFMQFEKMIISSKYSSLILE